MAMTEVVDPNDLRFTQDIISPAFKHPYQGVFLEDVIAQIKRKDVTPSTFPKPEVIKHENTLWCLNNRRLYVFRKAKVDKIDVQISMSRMHPRLSSVLEDPGKKKKMMKKGYFPFVLPYKPGKRVHTTLPPPGYPPIPPRQPGYCSPTTTHHSGPNSNAVVGQLGGYHPWSSPMQYPCTYIWQYSMEVASPNEHYFGAEGRSFLPNASNFNGLPGSTEPISIAAAKVQEHHVVQIGPARNLEVAVCASPPPIVISPRPKSTSKWSQRQVPSGPIVCAYKKEERLALPMTTRSMKPNACRDPKPVCSGKDVKGKVAAVVEKESSRLPSKKPSAAGPTMSSACPPSASWRDPNLETGVRKVKPDSISPGMGNPKATPKQPKEAPRVLDASMDVLDWQPINLGIIPYEELPDKRMDARILATDDHKPVEIKGISMDLLDWQPINPGTIPNEDLPDKRMTARILATDHKPVEFSGTLSPPALGDERVVDIPPASESDDLLRHVPDTNISRIWSPLHVLTRYILRGCGYGINLLKKLGRHLRRPSASA
jgi:hypothetical protein